MNEIEADRRFYGTAEAAFIRRRGTPFLLSPRDFALLKEWHALGVPIEAVEQGIDDAFTRREERGATGRINSLAYCRDAVLAAWERRAAASVGRGSQGESPEPDAASALSALEELLLRLEARRPDLSEPIGGTRRSLQRLASSGKPPGEIEAALARQDRKLAAALLEHLPESDRAAISAEAQSRLSAARTRMDDVAATRTLHALERRLLRERLDLPRLTLLP